MDGDESPPERVHPKSDEAAFVLGIWIIQRQGVWVAECLLRIGGSICSFVFSELLKATAWNKELVSAFYYRDKDQLEVDFVLENSAGQIVGIEVKAAASVSQRDFGGLRRVAAAAGSAFVQDILLYHGEQTLRFGRTIRAAPLSTLWV